MKAIVCKQYGSPEVLQWQHVEKPVPKDNEILIKIHTTTVTSADCRVRGLNTPKGFRLLMRLALGINRPRQAILGSELAGTVAAIGANVSRFQVGDPVFAFTDTRMGCYAEYTCLPEKGAIVRKPANLSFAEAAALSFGGTTALHFLRKAKLQSGDKILINGASGGVGTAAVQLAKHFGAEVTGVCSTTNLALVKSLGVDHVIDYTQEDFTQQNTTYHVILDTTGNVSYAHCKAALKAGGRLVLVAASLPEMLAIPWGAMTGNKRLITGVAFGDAKALSFLADLALKGKYRPVIDRCFPFEQIVAAHRYVDSGRKKGNVVVTTLAETSG
ncbi:MAG: NAD(P)-dependent alcohol dehydrogenase [Candidatus Thiothrix putei]|uniref:NAD(P)-dependent alcohol dehydrogenase n=1 Tax=Candidatus Thiothrix putei TaxID=3080811 RepID=A0AA95KJ07_9GAMM|nr:MAG: NAD(P)-dependent alcohol dehydrogenase [Candidatus Thiothrix putei]